jgi:PAS domain S-box-containing protein
MPADAPALDTTLVTAFLESVPDLVYFKDRASRFIAVSNSKARRHGHENPANLIGKTDADFFSAQHAKNARDDEEEIMRTGTAIVGQVEKLTWQDGRETWARTTKLPLRDGNGTIIGTFGISQDVTASKATEDALERTRRDLIEASRFAGMAEVATGVLHNVGNVLNSLNVSSTLVADGLRQSKAASLQKLSALVQEHVGDLPAFLTQDPRGRRVPELLATLAANAVAERDRLLAEVQSLQQNVDHIREIVVMQQSYATMAGVVEPLDAVALMEDSLRMNSGALARHEVRVVRDFQPVPAIVAERGKVLQILVNLIRNAKYAADDGGASDKVVTLRIAPGTPGRVLFEVQDNGIGIAPEHLTRIFAHGFTTKKDGHGFGLHSSANAAREMKGNLTVRSAGVHHGATFTLDLPIASDAVTVSVASPRAA